MLSTVGASIDSPRGGIGGGVSVPTGERSKEGAVSFPRIIFRFQSGTVIFWRCDAQVTSSFVIFAVLVLRVVLTRRCNL